MATVADSTAVRREGASPIPELPRGPEAVPALRNGDRLTAAEFERRYRAMPHLKKAELIEGVVYVASPVSDLHGINHFDLIIWIGAYRVATPGVVGSAEGTVRLDIDNRPQPDVHLRLLPSHGGRCRVGLDHGYVEGPPEFVAEVAASSASYDLHDKLQAYRRNEVLEYLVWRVEDRVVDWFHNREGQFVRLAEDAEGILKSETFPGLWLDPAALVSGDMARVVEIARRGIESPEHAAYVARLRDEAARREAAAAESPRKGDQP